MVITLEGRRPTRARASVRNPPPLGILANNIFLKADTLGYLFLLVCHLEMVAIESYVKKSNMAALRKDKISIFDIIQFLFNAHTKLRYQNDRNKIIILFSYRKSLTKF